jgi:penicillin-binding protein 1A
LLAQWETFLCTLAPGDAELFRTALEVRRAEVRTRETARITYRPGRWILAVAKDLADLTRVPLVNDVDQTLFFARLAASETARVGVRLDNVKTVLVFIEDRRFYRHKGVSPRAIFRALASLAGLARRSGGSTITQQLARTLLIKDLGKVYRRKLVEILLALWLERVFTKSEILDLYLSSVRFARRKLGITAAMKHFFGAVVADASRAQAFLLVERVSNEGTRLLLPRVDHTLRQAVDSGVLSQADAHELPSLYARLLDEGKLECRDSLAFERFKNRWS